jgi:superoxide reductase
MRLLEENYEGPGQEKHIPIVTRNENGLSVIVGSNSHPMEKDHFIEWIEVISDKNIIREYLSPGSAPEAKFNLNDDNIIVREYCNVHGLWING